jgi:hypothetical protein
LDSEKRISIHPKPIDGNFGQSSLQKSNLSEQGIQKAEDSERTLEPGTGAPALVIEQKSESGQRCHTSQFSEW